jgi:EAL domain-containing protein (putative c-di-GMP-specific phosphodiesterase class I)
VQSIVQLARGFGYDTIAEGVESEETLDILRTYGVDYAQGYHLGVPAPLRLQGNVATSGIGGGLNPARGVDRRATATSDSRG